MRGDRRHGQTSLILLLAAGTFLLGGVGLAIESGILFLQRQMAQAAADAAAEAAIMSAFNGTNTATYGNAFGASAFDCGIGTSDLRTPCVYARYHSFGLTADDTVSVDFPTSVPGVTLSDDDDPAAIGVTVSRTVDVAFMRFVGGMPATVRARAVAVITDVFSPVPIIILHPTFGPGVGGGNNSDAAFEKAGDNTVTICGGPTKSIQVNTNHETQAVRHSGNGVVDLSRAGPENFVNIDSCDGAGADFGQFGGPNPYFGGGNLLLGSDGDFVQPASPIEDPLRDVVQPAPFGAVNPATVPIDGSDARCPLAPGQSCRLYSPGIYTNGIEVKNEFAIFRPGAYFTTDRGFQLVAGSAAHMDSSCDLDPLYSAADYGCGMMVINSGNNSNQDVFFFGSNSGTYPPDGPYSYTYPDGSGCTGNCFLGTEETGAYKGILFWENRSSGYKQHQLNGGGGLTLRGTVYLTSQVVAGNSASESNYQWLWLGGNSGSSTRVIGMILVDRLRLGGTSDIVMTLNPNASLNIRQVALAR